MNTSLFNRRKFLAGTTHGSLAVLTVGAFKATAIASVPAKTGLTEAGLSRNATPRQVSESYSFRIPAAFTVTPCRKRTL